MAKNKPSLLNSAIAWISPQRACEREAWRQQYELMKGYDAAGNGRLNANWRARNEAAEYTDRMSRDTIRARARDLERNSDMAGGILSAFKRNIIGYGYTLQAKTGDRELDKKIEREWKEWTKKINCDVTGQQSFNAMMRMAIQRKKVDGGILFLKCYSGKGKIPFQLQALEVDELSQTQLTPKNKGNKVIGGIELTEYNKPVGYWIERYQLDGWKLSEPMYYPAKRVLYLWQKNRPSQVREISEFAPTLTRIRDANELMTAVSVKERIAACLAVFIKRSIPSATGFGGRGSSPSAENRHEYSGRMLAPGMVNELNAGDEIQVVDPKGNANEAKEMLAIQQRLIASGHGLSYESTSRDMSGVNYSSARQGAIEDDLAIAEDSELIEELMDEIYETFIISGYLAGVFDMPGFFTDYDKKLSYLHHNWVASAKAWIDPQKEASANAVALEKGFKTYAQIIAESGRDWKEHIDEMAECAAYCAEKGVKIGGELYGQAQQQPTVAESGDTDGNPDDAGEPDGKPGEDGKPATENEGGTAEE